MAHVSHGDLTLAFAVMHFFGDSPNIRLQWSSDIFRI